MSAVTDADREKAAEGWMPPDEGCTCGQTDGSLLADHAASCALMLCRRCGMELPDHLPGDDRCHPACGRPHLDDPAIAAALAAEREAALAPVLALAEELERSYVSQPLVRADGVADRIRAAAAPSPATDTNEGNER